MSLIKKYFLQGMSDLDTLAEISGAPKTDETAAGSIKKHVGLLHIIMDV